MFTKNQTVTLTIDDISSDGNGVGKVDGFAVFVPFTAKGDTIRCRIVKVNRTFAFGIVEELLSPSPDRIATDCPVFTKCGGCAFRHLRYEAECEAKQKWVQDCLQRIGGFSIEVLPIVPSVRQDGYRNKAQYPVCKNPDGTLAIGFYAKRSHRVISCADCKLQPPIFREIVEAIQIFVTRNGISIYDEESHSGLLRHIFLRIAEATGQIMVCLVINGKDFPHKSQLVDCLRALSSQIVSIVLNFNLKQTNVILGPKCLTIYGSDLIADQLCDMTFQLSPLSFYQVNRTSTEKLYAIAREFAALTGDETVLDLYCGTGTIGLSAAAHLKRLIGVEIVPEAVENAQANAAANGIEHAEFYCADASQAVVRLAEQGVSPDVIFVDPPRKGCDPEVLEAISQLSPSRVVMVSCNPATLARDCRALADKGYILQKAAPVDMFPRVAHVETVVLLSRGTYPQSIEVKIDVSDGEVTEQPTYKRIQEYVKAKYGFNVHTAYIAEVKRMCGLDMHKAPNAVEQRKHEYHPCPPEKVEAIKSALQHFGLIE